jgi:hypothetical protein
MMDYKGIFASTRHWESLSLHCSQRGETLWIIQLASFDSDGKVAQLIFADVSGHPDAEVYRIVLQSDKWCFKYEEAKGGATLHQLDADG